MVRGLRPKGIPCSKETKIKIGNSNRGNFKTIEERTRISNTLKRKLLSGEIIHPRGFLGKKHKNKLQLYRNIYKDYI